ncbi:MAG: hypothetical protein RMK80_03290 [Pseudobdellovibrionaceae bacterium]|nr:hypothetical protein [Pseudobdellovibrionaceae bacterium]
MGSLNVKMLMAILGMIGGILSGSLFFLLSSGCGNQGGNRGGGTPPVAPAAVPVPAPAHREVGFYAQTKNFYIPGYVNQGSYLEVEPGMYTLLKEAMGVCNRDHTNTGIANCQSWLTGAFDLVLFSEHGSTANTVKIVMRAIPGSQLNGYGWYYASLPKFRELIGCLVGLCYSNPQGIFNPMVLEGPIWPINNSRGFEFRAYGPTGSGAYNKLIQYQVAEGKLEDGAFTFVLSYNGVQAARGRAVRCQSQFCGLDASYFRIGY